MRTRPRRHPSAHACPMRPPRPPRKSAACLPAFPQRDRYTPYRQAEPPCPHPHAPCTTKCTYPAAMRDHPPSLKTVSSPCKPPPCSFPHRASGSKGRGRREEGGAGGGLREDGRRERVRAKSRVACAPRRVDRARTWWGETEWNFGEGYLGPYLAPWREPGVLSDYNEASASI